MKGKNYSWLGSYQTWVPIVISTKFPAMVMVLRVMSYEGDVQPVWEKEVWPPISPNSNPLDYFACGVTESKVNATPHNKIYDWSRRSRRWRCPSTETPWWGPATASRSRLRLSSLLTAILLNKSIFKIFLFFQLLFISIKSDNSQMCSVVFKKGV